MIKLTEINVENKRVLLRADLNVPLKNGEITDDNRIKMSVPTIKYLLEKNCSIVICSHLGRPAGKVDTKYSLEPVRKRLSEILDIDIKLAADCISSQTKELANSLKQGEVLLLENLRFHPEEKNNDEAFSKELASLGQVFVSDAFATAHREHASMTGVTKFFDLKCAGLLMEKEFNYYEKALLNPQAPYCVVLGGAKVSGKLQTLLNISNKADKIIIGGAMANTFYAAQGFQMGRSLFEPELYSKVQKVMANIARRHAKLYLPVDFRVGKSPSDKTMTSPVTYQELPSDLMALDIGPASEILFEEAIRDCSTIVWNGPMGCFENENFSSGTESMITAIGAASGLTVVGGGDTDAAIHKMELSHKFDYISTGGGAFLALMEGSELPGFKVLK